MNLNHYDDYQDYINRQKKKTTDPVRRRKWLNEEWDSKNKGFEEIFQRYKDIIHGNVLCIGARTGQEVYTLQQMFPEINAIGIDLVPHEPM